MKSAKRRFEMKLANLLTIDFESWAYPDLTRFRKISSGERKQLDNGFVLESGDKILTILRQYNVKMTFFILGELYEWYPDLIHRIQDEGHEIAYHSHCHDILTSKEVLLNSLERSRKFLDTFKPKGFRAPDIFFKEEYFEILKEYGFRYDSSNYAPCGSGNEFDGIKELPITTFPLLAKNEALVVHPPRTLTASVKAGEIPFGSAYLLAVLGRRVVPFFRRVNRQGKAAVAIIHNWQIVRPRKATFPTSSYLFRHPMYLPYCLDCSTTFEHLIKALSIAPIIDVLGNEGGTFDREF